MTAKASLRLASGDGPLAGPRRARQRKGRPKPPPLTTMRMCNMDNFLEQARAREEAAKLIIDQSTRVALWMLCKDAKLEPQVGGDGLRLAT